MNYTKAACGHMVPAVGPPGSIARSACESQPCRKCANESYWQQQYDKAVPIPLSEDRIQEIVDYVINSIQGEPL